MLVKIIFEVIDQPVSRMQRARLVCCVLQLADFVCFNIGRGSCIGVVILQCFVVYVSLQFFHFF